MNDYDKSNLNFMLNADDATLAAWYASLSGDDLAYAMELLAAGLLELAVRDAELLGSILEVNLRKVELFDDVTDLSDAASVLQKFRLN